MLRNSTIICILLVLLGLSMQNCNIINPKEITPTYIHIDSFRTNNLSHKITAVWVYYNNSPVGVFDLPATFPVNATGTGKMLFSPGVPVNGQYSLMANYPFYTSDSNLTLNAQPGKIVTYQPFTDYYPGRTEYLISNFENGTTGFAMAAGNIGLSWVGPNSETLSGGAGGIFLNAVGDSSIDTTRTSFTIPAGKSAFIEFDYRTTIPFMVGLEGTLAGLITTGPYYLAGITPNDQWQKFYLNVQAFATQYNATYYHFYIKGVLAPGQTSGRLLIDNIKLLYF